MNIRVAVVFVDLTTDCRNSIMDRLLLMLVRCIYCRKRVTRFAPRFDHRFLGSLLGFTLLFLFGLAVFVRLTRG